MVGRGSWVTGSCAKAAGALARGNNQRGRGNDVTAVTQGAPFKWRNRGSVATLPEDAKTGKAERKFSLGGTCCNGAGWIIDQPSPTSSASHRASALNRRGPGTCTLSCSTSRYLVLWLRRRTTTATLEELHGLGNEEANVGD
ncbi:hypothetical protein HPP92_027347 [Vanilla planifolia]|uniref:Uncharacterized protein n=1 Tax=Vanilla planifolia TaxID=51239 RepID=A0A835PAE3_VANPL|nr:hypothetical protein HPP92_027347 [Vanilla planifolia]